MVNGDGVVRRRQWRQIAGSYPGVHRRLDQPRDRAKFDLAGDECPHRDLVGGIISCGGAAACPQGIVSQPKRRETIEIWHLEGPLSDLGEIALGRRTDDAIGPSEAMPVLRDCRSRAPDPADYVRSRPAARRPAPSPGDA